MIAQSFLALVWLAHPLVNVAGPSDCPRPEAVAERLLYLLPESAESGGVDRAVVSSEGAKLKIELRREDGVLLGERLLPASASCQDLAAAAAAVIAAWEAALRPALVPSPEFAGLPVPSHVAPLVRLPSRPAPARPEALPVPEPLPQPPSPPPLPPPPSPEPPQPTPPPLAPLDVGAGVGASWAATLTPSFALQVTGAPASWRLGWRTALAADWPHAAQVGLAKARWTRIALQLGPRFRIGSGRLRFDWHAEAMLAEVLVSGSGYPHDLADHGLAIAAGAGTRALLCGRRHAFWVEVAAALWPRRETLRIDAVPTVGYGLPLLEVDAILGFSLGRFR